MLELIILTFLFLVATVAYDVLVILLFYLVKP